MKEIKQYLRGSGSGKGGQQHTPVEADDSLSSIPLLIIFKSIELNKCCISKRSSSPFNK